MHITQSVWIHFAFLVWIRPYNLNATLANKCQNAKKNDTCRSKQWVSIKFKGRKMGKENKDHIPCY